MDTESKKYKATCIGKRQSLINQKLLLSGEEFALNDGDVIELMPGKFRYQFEEDSSSPSSIDIPQVDQLRSEEEDVVKKQSTNDEQVGWKKQDNLLIYRSVGVVDRAKIAAFDLDGTLITTQSGFRFPKDEFDWKILFPEIPGALKKLQADGYKVVIFTNQKGVTVGRQSEEGLKRKIEDIRSKIGVPFQTFMCIDGGFCRKPLVGMWEELEKQGTVDRAMSFYVGDAAGRIEDKKGGRKKDHSCADRLFALNLNVKFFTPEEFFLKKPIDGEKFQLPDFDPKSTLKVRTLLEPSTSNLYAAKPEIVVLVGYPASGKSTFADAHFKIKGYKVVNRDSMKTWQKCVQLAEKTLTDGGSVIVDNTNPDKASRMRYVELAKRLNVGCRCFVMNVDLSHAMHNNKFRQLAGLSDAEHKNVTDMVLFTYRKNYEEPSCEEGFTEIVRVNFVPEFDDEHLKRLYSMYLLEK